MAFAALVLLLSPVLAFADPMASVGAGVASWGILGAAAAIWGKSQLFRLADEVEASAAGIAAHMAHAGASATLGAARLYVGRHRFGALAYPYFIWADMDVVAEEIAERAARLRGGADGPA